MSTPPEARDRARGVTDGSDCRKRSAGPLRPANGAPLLRPRRSPDETYDASSTLHSIEAVSLAPEDNGEPSDDRFSAVVRELEHIAAAMDALQHDLESAARLLLDADAQTVTGAGVIHLIVKAETLSSELRRFSAVLRANESRGAVRAVLDREGSSPNIAKCYREKR